MRSEGFPFLSGGLESGGGRVVSDALCRWDWPGGRRMGGAVPF